MSSLTIYPAIDLKDGLAVRLEQGDKLLRQSGLSVSEIAFATGYSSSSHFSRAYRRQFGASPRQALAG